MHPLYRTVVVPLHWKMGDLKYHAKFYEEIVLEAVLVWPTSFVGETVTKWKSVIGQAILLAQNNWKATRGSHLSGMRDNTNACKSHKHRPTKADELLSFIYSARYHSESEQNLCDEMSDANDIAQGKMDAKSQQKMKLNVNPTPFTRMGRRTDLQHNNSELEQKASSFSSTQPAQPAGKRVVTRRYVCLSSDEEDSESDFE